jgi:hypothetical protein
VNATQRHRRVAAAAACQCESGYVQLTATVGREVLRGESDDRSDVGQVVGFVGQREVVCLQVEASSIKVMTWPLGVWV